MKSELVGAKELLRRLATVPAAAQRACLRNADAVARQVAGRARAIAPRRTNRLADGIHAEAAVETRSGAAARVVVDEPGAAAQEFGTAHNAAQPFMRPAAIASGPDLARGAAAIADAVADAASE